MTLFFGNKTHVHLVGIKGVGMTALAQVLKGEGYTVSGSDTSEEFPTDAVLRKLNIRVSEGFNPLNIPPKAELIIHSAAYSHENNIELSEAVKMNMETMNYPEALGKISAQKYGIAVAGTHGKTTTTAMLGSIMNALGFDPTIICGSSMRDFDGLNARVGKSNVLVAETCEYRRHFLNFLPRCIVLTNVEEDHMDFFKNEADYMNTFERFLKKLPEGGLLVMNNDDARSVAIAQSVDTAKIHVLTYALTNDANWTARDIKFADGKTTFTACLNGEQKEYFSLPIPGKHNIYNALAALALAYNLLHEYTPVGEQVSLGGIKGALNNFLGTGRRFEWKGIIDGVSVYDDYAHHPTEIQAMLRAAREVYPSTRIWAVFMPHTYSRTKALFKEFSQSFNDADKVIINKVYPSARETGMENKPETKETDGAALAGEIMKTKPDTLYCAEFSETVKVLHAGMKPGDVVITIGAGDNWKIGEALLQYGNTDGKKSKLRIAD